MILKESIKAIQAKINTISTLLAEIEILEEEIFTNADNLMFVCSHCGDVLHYNNYGIVDEQFYCLKHYKQILAEDMR